ncbi:unnamed protein product [Orchesella dallaii]|uniref:Uncharacterized protein n=1 Tax=Orchesella dallaii TaxID=48710 RepID=A0ABP1PMJ6_9HEXA
MSDLNPRPSATGGVGKKISVGNKSRTSMASSGSGMTGRTLERGKPVKVGGVGGNLLPSRMSVSGAGPSGRTSNAVGSRDGAGSVLRPPASNTERLSNGYELYLQSLLQDLIVQRQDELKHKVFADKMALKCVVAARGAYRLNKIFINKLVLSIFGHIMGLTKLANPLENLLDFTGEEALSQIQAILSAKFDRIIIEGGVLNKPLFEDVEVNKITEALKTGMRKNCEEKTVLEFGTLINEVLKKLEIKLQISQGNNRKAGQRNKILLESCTVAILNSHALALQLTPSESIESVDQ